MAEWIGCFNPTYFRYRIGTRSWYVCGHCMRKMHMLTCDESEIKLIKRSAKPQKCECQHTIHVKKEY